MPVPPFLDAFRNSINTNSLIVSCCHVPIELRIEPVLCAQEPSVELCDDADILLLFQEALVMRVYSFAHRRQVVNVDLLLHLAFEVNRIDQGCILFSFFRIGLDGHIMGGELVGRERLLGVLFWFALRTKFHRDHVPRVVKLCLLILW